MSNVLSTDLQTTIVHALAEGNGIRAIERQTGVHRDTIMRLGVRVGTACERMMDATLRRLNCQRIEIDEMWSYVGKKARNVTEQDNAAQVGDFWTYVAIDPDTKLVPSYIVGKRDFATTHRFITDLSERMENRIQLTADGMNAYVNTVGDVFGANVDFAQSIKIYEPGRWQGEERRYSPKYVTGVKPRAISGNPDLSTVTTAHVERQNLTMRGHIRRLVRLTNAFSKKVENLRAAVGLHFAYYNYVLTHSAIRCTPAMQAGVASRLWTVKDLVTLTPRWIT